MSGESNRQLSVSFRYSFRPRELAVRAEIIHDGPAYVGESTQVHVDIANEDSQAVDVSLDLLLQPGADDSRENLRWYLLACIPDRRFRSQRTRSWLTIKDLRRSSGTSRWARCSQEARFERHSACSALALLEIDLLTSLSVLCQLLQLLHKASTLRYTRLRRCALSPSRLCIRSTMHSIRTCIIGGRQ